MLCKHRDRPTHQPASVHATTKHGLELWQRILRAFLQALKCPQARRPRSRPASNATGKGLVWIRVTPKPKNHEFLQCKFRLTAADRLSGPVSLVAAHLIISMGKGELIEVYPAPFVWAFIHLLSAIMIRTPVVHLPLSVTFPNSNTILTSPATSVILETQQTTYLQHWTYRQSTIMASTIIALTEDMREKLTIADEKRDMFSFTKTMRDKLPRELRDIVYSYILDPAMIHDMHSSAYPERLQSPITYHPPAFTWPLAFKPGVYHEDIRSEIVQAYCDRDGRIDIAHPRDAEDWLEKDLFDTGVQPKHCLLTAVTIHGVLKRGREDSINPDTLLDQLAPLLRSEQRLSPTFKLTFRLSTFTHLPCARNLVTSSGLDHHQIEVFNLVKCLRALESVFQSLRERLESANSKRKVVLKLDFFRLFKATGGLPVVEVEQEMMAWYADEWNTRAEGLASEFW